MEQLSTELKEKIQGFADKCVELQDVLAINHKIEEPDYDLRGDFIHDLTRYAVIISFADRLLAWREVALISEISEQMLTSTDVFAMIDEESLEEEHVLTVFPHSLSYIIAAGNLLTQRGDSTRGAEFEQAYNIYKEVGEAIIELGLHEMSETHDAIDRYLKMLCERSNYTPDETSVKEEWQEPLFSPNCYVASFDLTYGTLSTIGKQPEFLRVKKAPSSIYPHIPESKDDLLSLANNGNADAFAWLADRLLDDGEVRTAMGWYSKAIENGSGYAARRIGEFYHKGPYLKKSMEEAVKYFEIGAKRNDDVAQYRLGCIYESGEAGQINLPLAGKYFLMSAKNGFLAAIFRVGKGYLSGDLYQQDKDLGYKWMFCAAERGYSDARYEIALLNKDSSGKKFTEEGFWWLQSAAQGGCNEAANDLGMCYLFGDFCPKDLKEAKRWLSRAARGGIANANNMLRTLEFIDEQ